jgi:tetratricopeptide (TPR) repeat protein
LLAERFPHHVPLHRLYVEWSRSQGAAEWERITRRALEVDASDAWLRRELALVLADQRRLDEAIAEAGGALKIEPQAPVSHAVLGRVLVLAGRQEEGRAALRSALALSIDTPAAMRDLVSACTTPEEKREAADFVRAELIRQVVFGDGLIAFRDAFFAVLDPPVLLQVLRDAHAARPDLWQAWSCLIRQLADIQQIDEAAAIAGEAAARFPLLPGSGLDLAHVLHLRGDGAGEVDALKRALAIAPGWSTAARELATAHQARAEYDGARRVLERAVENSPLDAVNHGCLAEFLWRRSERAAAFDRLILAVQHDPDYDWAWECLHGWAKALKQPERAVAAARQLADLRPGEPQSWLRLAQTLPEDRLDERLAALDRGLRADEANVEIHDFRAQLLSRAGRMDEAAAACVPAIFEGRIPLPLRGRAACVEAVRGHGAEAIRQMREILAGAPGYYWGWSMLASGRRNWAGMTMRWRLP